MFCKECGMEADKNDSFCRRCGAKIDQISLQVEIDNKKSASMQSSGNLSFEEGLNVDQRGTKKAKKEKKQNYSYKNKFIVYRDSKGRPVLGGWLYLMAIGIVLGPFVILFGFGATMNVKEETVKFAASNYSFDLLINVLVFLSIFNLCMSIYLAYLFFSKKSTFVFFYVRFFIIIVVAYAIVDIWSFYLGLYGGKEIIKIIISDISGFIPTFIWVLYLIKSRRVKETFIF